jgi:serine protease AprX
MSNVSAAYGIRWEFRQGRLVAALVAALLGFAAFVGMQAAATQPMTSVVVAARDGSVGAAVRSVEAAGGKVGRRIPLIHGFLAKVPSNRMATLRTARGVLSLTVDRAVTLSSSGPGSAGNPGASLAQVKREIGADKLAARGIDGDGVDIATIDSGVVPVDGLDGSSQIFVGPDLTPEAADPSTRGLDTFGHGTHLAGIMVGDNPSDGFSGIAPGARLVSVKAATHDGSTNLGELLLALSWVVSHRHSDGLNIRVLSLAFGSPLDGSYIADPLAYAAEQAWKAGIVVVAAAGNGNDVLGLNTPAADPFVISVGATSMGNSPALTDDSVASWSRVGNWSRSPDVVAPGTSIVSLRDPDSFIDQNYPSGRVGKDYFKGSGTSQATAVTAGAAALLIQDEPDLTPDQVKALLVSGAHQLPGAPSRSEGAGQIDVAQAAALPAPDVEQDFPAASLNAILRAAHGMYVRMDPVGTDARMTSNRWSANRWSSNRWSSNRWSSNRWSGSSWGDDNSD